MTPERLADMLMPGSKVTRVGDSKLGTIFVRSLTGDAGSFDGELFVYLYMGPAGLTEEDLTSQLQALSDLMTPMSESG